MALVPERESTWLFPGFSIPSALLVAPTELVHKHIDHRHLLRDSIQPFGPQVERQILSREQDSTDGLLHR